MNANLDNLWALVTNTIGHPLHLKKSNYIIQGNREKTTWEKGPPSNYAGRIMVNLVLLCTGILGPGM